MLAAALIVAGIAIVDSLNPATIAPALVLAVSATPVRRILEFAAGFFVVNVAGGMLLVLGLSLLPHPSAELRHAGEVVVGIVLLAGAVVLFALRDRLTRPRPKKEVERRRSGSALLLGGGIALAELPTAFPYFAAVAAIAAADLSRLQELVLIAGFNLLFLTPVLVMALLIEAFPSTWARVVDPVRRSMAAHWPVVLAAILGVGGIALLVAGVSSATG